MTVVYRRAQPSIQNLLKAMGLTAIDARDLRRRTVKRVMEDLGCVSGVEREEVEEAIKHMYWPDLKSGMLSGRRCERACRRDSEMRVANISGGATIRVEPDPETNGLILKFFKLFIRSYSLEEAVLGPVLMRGKGVCLDEGCWVWIDGFGSVYWISKWINRNTKMQQVSITAVMMTLVMVQPETAEMAALAVQFDDTAGLLPVVVVAA
ncbi:hypothetical protein LguiA_016629 [Lonicera macranthoides]